MNLLSENILEKLPPSIQRSSFKRNQKQTKVLHIGLGNFHKAHQAVYIDRLSNEWGIAGVSLRSPRASQNLKAQDSLYCVSQFSANERNILLVQSLVESLFAPTDRERVNEISASKELEIISATVTEKAYFFDQSSGGLDWPALEADLKKSSSNLYSFLFNVLSLRFKNSKKPITFLTCDNLRSNGRRLKTCIVEYLERHDKALSKWVELEVEFPNSVVDRIVPKTEEAQIETFSKEFGFLDRSLVETESFSQWTIENRFSSQEPGLREVGVDLVENIETFELRKLHILNAAHSFLAYVGQLLGYQKVDESVQDPLLKKLIQKLWKDEAEPKVGECRHYQDLTLLRFENSFLQHRLDQIAMDGSKKIIERWAPLMPGSSILLDFAVASWLRYMCEMPILQRKQLRQDPLLQRFEGASISDVLKIHKDFGSPIASNAERVESIFRDLFVEDPREVVRKYGEKILNEC